MNTVVEMLDILNAYEKGAKIEMKPNFRTNKDYWRPDEAPDWNFRDWTYRVAEEKIEVETHYRPFKSCEELLDFWGFHYCNSNKPKATMPIIWIKDKETKDIYHVTAFYHNSILGIDDRFIQLDKLLEEFTFLDDTPCGVLDIY